MSGLTKWLRLHAELCEHDGCPDEASKCLEAVREIERLREVVAEMSRLLKKAREA